MTKTLNMKYFFFGSFTFIQSLLVVTPMTAQEGMRLSDCLEYALQHHPQVRVAQLQLKDADWRIRENKSAGLPQVTLGLGAQRFLQRPALPAEALGFQAPPGTRVSFALINNLNFEVQASELLFSYSYLLSQKAANRYRELVQYQLEEVREQVRNQVTDAYLPALLIAENMRTLEKNFNNLSKIVEETRKVNQAGFAEQLDVDRLEYALETLRSERLNLGRQYEVVLGALRFAMGRPAAEALELADNLEGLLAAMGDPDLSSPLNLKDRVSYNILSKSKELTDIQYQIYKNGWYPTVAAFVQYQGGYQGNNTLFWVPQSIAGISVNATLFDSGGSKARQQRALIAVQTLDNQQQLLESGFQLELETARKQYLNAQSRADSQLKNVSLAKRIYDATETKYKAGVGSSFELVTAEQNLYTAQQSLMQARYDLLISRTAIKRAMGTTSTNAN
jgi:outer membrane protein TolC